MSPVEWHVDYDTAEAYYNLSMQLELYEIDTEEFAERVAQLKGYPLGRELQAGDDLRVVLNVKTRVQVPRSLNRHERRAKEATKRGTASLL